ncbi:MAG TPA: extracellular solute-binding protein [Chloroflexota bacterium]|nr:extracellular solute-binding protein [Chloroflexota bacterium]
MNTKRPFSRRRLVLGAVAATAIGALAACGRVAPTPVADQANDAPTPTAASGTGTATAAAATAPAARQLTVWYFDKASMETAIPIFERANPDVKVSFVLQPFGDMSKKYLAVLAAKQGVPDVVGLDTSMVGRFLDAGENLMVQPYDAGRLRNDFVAWKFDAPITPSGEMPAFPWDLATGVMFYRPDLFQAAKLPTDPDAVGNAIKSWEDYITAGIAVRGNNGRVAMVANEKDVFNAAFLQNGGNIVVDNKIVFPSEAAGPLELAMRAKQAGIGANVATWSERWAPAIKSGGIATLVMGAWMLGNLQNLIDPAGAGKWRIAVPPGGAFNHGGTYVQIPKLAKNKELAWAFVRSLTATAETQNAVFQKTGIVPAYKPAWDSPLYDQPIDYLGGQTAWRLLTDLAQKVKPLAYSPVDALGTDLLSAQVDAAIGGKVAPKDALAGAAAQLQERALRASDLKLELEKSAS